MWQEESLTSEQRREALGFTGATIWLTGLPASGKSTLAGALERRLVTMGGPAYRLDGDNLRHGLNADLSFEPVDRAENVRRTAHAARFLADAGAVALVRSSAPTPPTAPPPAPSTRRRICLPGGLRGQP